MAAKVSLKFVAGNNSLPVYKATEFFLGCADAFLEMGMYKHRQLVDLVEVVRIYPNQGMMTDGQIVVEVVVSGPGGKANETTIISLDHPDPIRERVTSAIVRLTRLLAGRIAQTLLSNANEFTDRLG